MEKFRTVPVDFNAIEGRYMDLVQDNTFTRSEMESILRERRKLVEKVNKPQPERADCEQIISHEQDFLIRLGVRRARKPQRIPNTETDFAILDTTKLFFRNLLVTYREDYELWMSFFSFCKRFKLGGCGSELLEAFTIIHGEKPSVWSYAFEWEEKMSNMRDCRPWLSRGIVKHPANIDLNEMFIKHELDYCKGAIDAMLKKNNLNSSTDSKTVLGGRDAQDCYEKAKMIVSDFQFYFRLYHLVKEYPFVLTFQETILRDLLERFPESEDVQDIHARLPMENVSFFPPEKDDEGKDIKRTMKDRVKMSVKKYNDALLELPTQKMWNFYLDFVISLQGNTRLDSYILLKRKLWKAAVEAAIDANKLEARHYVSYIKFLKSDEKRHQAQRLVNLGTIAHPGCVDLWYERIAFHLRRMDEEEAMAAFNEANEALGRHASASDLFRIWQMMLRAIMALSDSRAEELYFRGMRMRDDLGELLKPMYLKWVVLMEGISAARRLLDNPIITTPPCLEFFMKLAHYEKLQTDMCKKSIRLCYETALRHFGDTHAEVWREYIQFEVSHGDGYKVIPLYENASRRLRPEQMDHLENAFPRDRVYMYQQGNI